MMTGFSTDLPDIPRLITAVAQWLACSVWILSLGQRIRGLKFAAVSAGFLVIQSVFMIVTDGFEGIAWNLCMAATALLMFCYIRVCTETTRNNAVCCCCIAFIASEFAASVEWQIWCYVSDTYGLQSILWEIGAVIVVYAMIFFLLWQLGRATEVEEEIPVSSRDVLMTVVMALLTFAVSNLGFLPVSVPFAGRDSVEIFNMRTLVDMGGLAIL